MFKKTLLLSLGVCNLLFADYYTSTDTILKLNENKSLNYENKIAININKDKVKIDTKLNISYLIDDNSPKQYKNISLPMKKYKPNPKNPMERIAYTENVSFPVYNFIYILINNILDKEFILKTKDSYLLVKVKNNSTSISTPLQDDENVIEQKFIVKKAFNKNLTKKDIKEEDILTKYITPKNGLEAIELIDEGVYKITKVLTPQLTKFLEEKKKRVVKVKKFDFSKEKIYTTYISSYKSTTQRLNVEYEKKGKNIIITAKSPISLFDPENKSDDLEENIGILRNIKNKILMEGIKIQKINGEQVLIWKTKPRNSIVLITYKTNGRYENKILSMNRGQYFYSIEGVLYLVSWMNENNINKKIFTFINGSLPFDVTMKKVGDKTYEMQKSGNTIYKFVLNDKNLIQTIFYPSYDLEISLESLESDTTLKNKEYLKNYQLINNIKLIKD